MSRGAGRLVTLALCAFLGLAGALHGERTARLRVQVDGLADRQGQVALALFDTKRAFAAGEQPVRRGFLEPPEAGPVIWEVEDLPYGRYAIKVFHDRNGNGRLDFHLLGAPSEPYGFSNDARGRFGPPKFRKARFRVASDSVEIRLTVR